MNIWENKILECIQIHFVVMALEETDFECQIQFRKRPKQPSSRSRPCEPCMQGFEKKLIDQRFQ